METEIIETGPQTMPSKISPPVINVGIWFEAPFDYSGGLNYIHNLLYALAQVNDGSVQPYIFFAYDVKDNIERKFSPYAIVVRTKLLQRHTALWLAHKLIERVFGVMPLFKAQLKSHRIDVLSHAWFVCKGRMPFRILGWIPDFQYLHLPEFFPNIDPLKVTRKWQNVIAQSDLVILSSNNALQDFKRVALLEHHSRGRVLQFISQPATVAPSSESNLESIRRKYGFNGKYFHLPNQFWAHKNHFVVLQAVNWLKQSGVEVQVLCTGNIKDYRNGTIYFDQLCEFIEANDLQRNIRILGLIDYCDVLFLMRNSIAVLNPSRFEGWSSSVEEAKSMGKPIVLSNIDTHVEQDPSNGYYFELNDYLALAKILAELWVTPDNKPHAVIEETAAKELRERTLAFGNRFLHMLVSTAGDQTQP